MFEFLNIRIFAYSKTMVLCVWSANFLQHVILSVCIRTRLQECRLLDVIKLWCYSCDKKNPVLREEERKL